MHIDGWRRVELEDGSSSSSNPEDQVLRTAGHSRHPGLGDTKTYETL
jgi:hypothetical protein